MKDKNTFTAQINGFEMTTDHQKMLAKDLLKLADKHGAIPTKWSSYVLKGKKDIYKQDELIDLSEDNWFITLLDRPTQVA